LGHSVDSVNLKQWTKGQTLLSYCPDTLICRHTHPRPIALPGPLKWPVVRRQLYTV